MPDDVHQERLAEVLDPRSQRCGGSSARYDKTCEAYLRLVLRYL